MISQDSQAPATPLLHVFLLTYNREKTLRRTLEAIAASSLKAVPLTIMDNSSTDGTRDVCAEFRSALPLMEVCSNRKNIGFGANYLRCIELSRGEYTWILCDDDTLFPDRTDSLLSLLREARPEACFAGGPRQEKWPAGTALRPSELQRISRTFTTVPSFVPAVVFKTALFGSAEVVEAYHAIYTNFPQMILGRKLLLNDIPCAVLKPPVIQREDPAEKGIGHLNVAAGWSEYCHTLPRDLRMEAFYSFYNRPGLHRMLRELLRMILWAKIDGEKEPAHSLRRIGMNMGFPVSAALIPCRLATLIPGSLYRLARNGYRKIKYGWLGKPLPANFHAPICHDELRR